MFISKKISELKQELDIDFQLLATELDISAKDLRYLSSTVMEHALQIDAFEKLYNDIKQNGIEITSFNDNTVLFNYLFENVIIYNELGTKFIIFDNHVTMKIESKLSSYI